MSVDVRNQHQLADTVLAIPLTTSVHKNVPTHVLLPAGETGLPLDSAAKAEDITVIRKDKLVEPHSKLRTISNTRVCQLGWAVEEALGCTP